ncbi:kinase-like domain-containing protein [Mycena rebaudengoi]|nr:kinase-like domain-containing protein [Mycena rebaudengoi]
MSAHSFRKPHSSPGDRSITVPAATSLQALRRLHHQTRISEDRQQRWSPFTLSSSSVSTKYASGSTDRFLGFPESHGFELGHDPSLPYSRLQSLPVRRDKKMLLGEKMPWGESMPWSEPRLLQHPRWKIEATDDVATVLEESVTRNSERTSSQDEVDRDLKVMTCGAEVEEHFWPVRYQIRHGRLHLISALKNAIRVLVVHARKQSQRAALSQLTGLMSRRVAFNHSLTSFLNETCSQREHLSKSDNLMIMLVFYEVLTSKADVEEVMKLRGDDAQFILDLTQDAIRTHLDWFHFNNGSTLRLREARRAFLEKVSDLRLLRHVGRNSAQLEARRLIVKISETTGLLPSSLMITGVSQRSDELVFGGSFGDIFRAEYQASPVALKRLRFFKTESLEKDVRQSFLREALIWKNLDHDYILPFIGIDSTSCPGYLCMVSPWMIKGPVVGPDGAPEPSRIPTLMYEIAMGLQYLHSQEVVHGDLRAANILIDNENHVRLADFGLARFAHSPLAPTNRGGSTRWMAPELLHPESCGMKEFRRTFSSDIYSFACVCLETGKPPFSEIEIEVAVMFKVIKGQRPDCPTTMSDWAARLMRAAWAQNPSDRLSLVHIIESIVKEIRRNPGRKREHRKRSEVQLNATTPPSGLVRRPASGRQDLVIGKGKWQRIWIRTDE